MNPSTPSPNWPKSSPTPNLLSIWNGQLRTGGGVYGISTPPHPQVKQLSTLTLWATASPFHQLPFYDFVIANWIPLTPNRREEGVCAEEKHPKEMPRQAVPFRSAPPQLPWLLGTAGEVRWEETASGSCGRKTKHRAAKWLSFPPAGRGLPSAGAGSGTLALGGGVAAGAWVSAAQSLRSWRHRVNDRPVARRPGGGGPAGAARGPQSSPRGSFPRAGS